MGVQFTADAEQERIRNRKAAYEYLRTFSLAEATRFARDHGWKDRKVQVKAMNTAHGEMEFYVEPFEKDCACPGILKYGDFFD